MHPKVHINRNKKKTVNMVEIEPNCQPHMQLGMVLYQLSYVANDNGLPHA